MKWARRRHNKFHNMIIMKGVHIRMTQIEKRHWVFTSFFKKIFLKWKRKSSMVVWISVPQTMGQISCFDIRKCNIRRLGKFIKKARWSDLNTVCRLKIGTVLFDKYNSMGMCAANVSISVHDLMHDFIRYSHIQFDLLDFEMSQQLQFNAFGFRHWCLVFSYTFSDTVAKLYICDCE